tara:strand:+ start:56625 stop:57002 length:378 start_codon:yes stop_codon:yes gene_type:complete
VSKKIFIIYILLFLGPLFTSCAGNLSLKLDDCNIAQTQIAPTNTVFNIDRSFTTKVWSYGISSDSKTSLSLKDILREKALSCVNIKYIRYTIGQSFWDQLFSIIPFIQRSSIKIEVMKTEDAVGF